MSPIEEMTEKLDELDVVTEIPILCRFWEEDGVWNGEAVDLPVAVFGETVEQAFMHLWNAVISHLEALQEIGKLKETAHILRTCARQHQVSMNEMSPNQLWGRFNAGLQNHRVVAIA